VVQGGINWEKQGKGQPGKCSFTKSPVLTSRLGAGYWQIMQFFQANWILLSQMFEARKVGD